MYCTYGSVRPAVTLPSLDYFLHPAVQANHMRRERCWITGCAGGYYGSSVSSASGYLMYIRTSIASSAITTDICAYAWMPTMVYRGGYLMCEELCDGVLVGHTVQYTVAQVAGGGTLTGEIPWYLSCPKVEYLTGCITAGSTTVSSIVTTLISTIIVTTLISTIYHKVPFSCRIASYFHILQVRILRISNYGKFYNLHVKKDVLWQDKGEGSEIWGIPESSIPPKRSES